MIFKKMNESISTPMEGFFWIIDGEIIGFAQNVYKYGNEVKQSKTHKETWNSLKPVGWDVEFDYYPRGRVMVDPNYDKNGLFTHYSALVFLDPCISNEKEKVIDYYNLEQIERKHNIFWMGNLLDRSGIDHYSCHNCRNK